MSAQEKSLADIGVQPQIVDALARIGITHPFPIQAMTLPVALSGHDIIGQAKTGTGKTLGFGIPLVQRVVGPGEEGFEDLEHPGLPQGLVVVPTRELAGQVAGDLQKASALRSVRILTLYGGRAYEPQVKALRKGIEIIVSTPGRLLDLTQQGHVDLGAVRHVVLDEADEMLDLGFLPDVEKILAMTPAGRQTMLFSATMPGAVVALARRYMTQPTHIRASDPDDTGATVASTAQYAYRAHSLDKTEMLARILRARGRGLTMVFSRTKRTAAKVAEELAERGFAAAAIHGDLGQGAREQALRAFRNGKVDVLIATDVAARGIDVEDVTHVVNYTCPEDEKTYLHRIGRTGRAGNTGTAITFVDWEDLPRWVLISRALDLDLADPPETYSSSSHLYSDLDIPEGTSGVLPRAERTRAGLEAEVIEDMGETGRKNRRKTSRSSAPAPRTKQQRRPEGRSEKARGAETSAREESPARAESPAQEAAEGTTGTRQRRTTRRRRTRLYEQRVPGEGGAAEDTAVVPAASSRREPAAQNGLFREPLPQGPADLFREPVAPQQSPAGPTQDVADGGSSDDASPGAPGRRRRQRRRGGSGGRSARTQDSASASDQHAATV